LVDGVYRHPNSHVLHICDAGRKYGTQIGQTVRRKRGGALSSGHPAFLICCFPDDPSPNRRSRSVEGWNGR
jgi:hypothetical protein